MPRVKPEHLVEHLFAKVADESRRREASRNGDGDAKAAAVRGLMMPHQLRLEQDPSRHVSVRAARRAGKTTGVLYLAIVRCLENRDSAWVILSLTRTASSVRDLWGTLRTMNDQLGLGLRFNRLEMSARFPNGSEIRFVGADKLDEVEKLRGSKYDGVVIDESKSFDAALFEELIQDVIEPALLDRNGVLYVVGTPGDRLAGPFYLATSDEVVTYAGEDGEVRRRNLPYGERDPLGRPAFWSLHRWAMRQNTTVFTDRHGARYTLWDKALEIKAARGWTDANPTWRREYLGEWVDAGGLYVYAYRPHVHDRAGAELHGPGPWGLPDKGPWHRIIGCDLGTRDGTAFVVWAYDDTHRVLYELYSEKRAAPAGQKITVDDVAAWYKELDATYGPFETGDADSAGLATMVLDTLAASHGVYLDPVPKREKNDYILMFNSDLDHGRVRILPGSALSHELATDRWDRKKLDGAGKRVEDPSVPNDVADAALYAFRSARHREGRPAVEGPAPLSPAWWAARAKTEFDAARAEAARDAADARDTTARLDRVAAPRETFEFDVGPGRQEMPWI